MGRVEKMATITIVVNKHESEVDAVISGFPVPYIPQTWDSPAEGGNFEDITIEGKGRMDKMIDITDLLGTESINEIENLLKEE
jgi:hypothetical protein